MTNKQILRPILTLICLYLIVSTVQSMGDLFRAREKISRREANLAQLQKEHDELLRQTQKTQSSQYLERIARDKLNLSKPGEETVIISEELLSPIVSETPKDTRPNWKKWQQVFF